MNAIYKQFSLDTASCDEIADMIMDFCSQTGTDRKDALRYRLSAEECLLYWIDHGLTGNEVTVQMRRFLRSFFVVLEVRGERLNPYDDTREDYGSFTDSILVNLGLSPEYSYSRDRNSIRFRIRKKAPNQIATICTVLGLAAATGILGMNFLPAAVREAALELVITPLYDTFFKLLGCIAGPMIFLSVAWGVYGIGDAATFGRIGHRMMRRYTVTCFISAAVGVLFFPLIGPTLSSASTGEGQFSTISELLFDIIPPNIIDPFQSGNTLQLIFLAVVIGIALLFLGKKTDAVATGIDQINILVQFLMQFVSKLVPYVIFLMVLEIIWSDSLSVFSMAWILFASLFVLLILETAAFVIITSVKMKVSPALLVRKNLPTFLIALSTASSAAAFETNVRICEKKLGIDQSLVKFGIPLGIVMHKPVTAAYNVLIIFYFASQYDISASVGWICVAVFISATIAIATPPIPGGGAIAYSVLFMQMGIPAEAMAVALSIDIITDFFITSSEMLVLPMSLINASSGMGMIDVEILRKDI